MQNFKYCDRFGIFVFALSRKHLPIYLTVVVNVGFVAHLSERLKRAGGSRYFKIKHTLGTLSTNQDQVFWSMAAERERYGLNLSSDLRREAGSWRATEEVVGSTDRPERR